MLRVVAPAMTAEIRLYRCDTTQLCEAQADDTKHIGCLFPVSRGQGCKLRIESLAGRNIQIKKGKQYRQGMAVTFLLEQAPAQLIERLFVGRYSWTQINNCLVGLPCFQVVAFAKQKFSLTKAGIGIQSRVGVGLLCQQPVDDCQCLPGLTALLIGP
jgi:hypothetical protein